MPVQQTPLTTNQSTATTTQAQGNRQLSSMKASPQHQNQKPSSNEVESLVKPVGQVKNSLDYEQLNKINAPTQQSVQLKQAASQQSSNKKETNVQNSQSLASAAKDSVQAQQTPSVTLAPENKSTNSGTVMKSESTEQGHYQKKAQPTTLSQLRGGRNIYRNSQEERAKQIDSTKKTTNERDSRTTGNAEHKSQPSPPSSRQQESEQSPSLEDSIASLSIGASRKTTWASIASQPAKVSQPKSLKSKIAGSNSVLSSAKHLAAVALDTSNLESKNGINPAIKSSVSAAATSIQRSSVPPPVSKLPAVAASLKLDLLGEESIESSRISWPAVNASINLTLDDPPRKENNSMLNSNMNSDEKHRKDDSYRNRGDFRDSLYKDHNHNQGMNNKMVNSYQASHGSGRDFWNNREPRDYRVRRDSDRKESNHENKPIDQQDDSREFTNQRRDYKPSGPRVNHFRGDEQYRERDFNKRGAMPERSDARNNDGYQNSRFLVNRYDSRDSHHQQQQHNNQPPQQHFQRHNETQQTQHHHYNNVRDGNTAGNSLSKLDLTLYPHLNPANFNPKTFNLEPTDARYFIIKSYSEDDIHRSIKYSIWCSTNHGNKRLDEAYRQQQAKNGPIYLFFSVNGSGHFCGMAQMMSSVDFDSSSGVWAQSKWQGEFSVKWVYVKDVPNSALRHITLENNEDKPVTNSRDTQEVPSEKGKAVLKILHQYSHTTSIFDDFLHYERRQEEEKFKKSHLDNQTTNRSEERERGGGGGGGSARFGRPYMNPRSHNDFPASRERSSRFAS